MASSSRRRWRKKKCVGISPERQVQGEPATSAFIFSAQSLHIRRRVSLGRTKPLQSRTQHDALVDRGDGMKGIEV